MIRAFSSHGADQKDTIRDPQLRQIYQSLRSPILADSSWTIADTLRFSFPDFRLTLAHGSLTALHDSTKNLTGLLFEGDAFVRFHPRSAPEQFQLARFTEDSVFSCGISRLVLRMVGASSLPLQSEMERQRLSALWSRPPDAKSRNRREAEKLHKTLDEGLRKRHNMNLPAHLLARELISPAGFVLCAFYPESSPHFSPPLYVYVFDALAVESTAFYSYFPKRIGRQFFTICSYALQHEASDSTAALRVVKYSGWVALEQNSRIHADMGVDVVTNGHKPAALSFTLSAELKVSRISAEMGDSLSFVQEPEEGGVTVFLPSAAWQNDTLRLFFQYEGEALLRHDNATFFLRDPVNWTPRLGYLERAYYNIIFKCPPRQRVLAIGDLVRDWDEGGHHLSFFKTPEPAKAATFCMGSFQTDTLMNARPGLPAIVMYTTLQRTHAERRRVAGDLANSLYFFGKYLGDYAQPYLRVVEAPTLLSQGFPGLVTLSWIGFSRFSEANREALRGHEIAHQWFGNLVGWRTYHDQWLSESFAQYLGAMYVEWLARSSGYIEQIVKAWRIDVLERGHVGANLGMQHFGLSKFVLRNAEGLKAGPIWMGIRLGQNDALDYYTQTYEKGALVVHMLRGLLRDLNTGSDVRFWNMLADFVATNRHREASTEDFQRCAEKHYGAPLDWFFRQWIYENQIPTYRWEYSIATVPAAAPSPPMAPLARALPAAVQTAQVVRIRVQQENVPEHFRMFIPVTLEWAGGAETTVRMSVTHDGGELEMPLSGELKRVIFNSGGAVLCRVKDEPAKR